MVSLFTSTVPSHHRIWTESGKLGLHVDPLPMLLKRAGYTTIFHGSPESHDVASQLGFEMLVDQNRGNISALPDLITVPRDKTPLLVVIETRDISTYIPSICNTFSKRSFVMMTQLVMNRDNHDQVIQKDITVPFAMLNHDIKRASNNATHFWSINDIVPSMLAMLECSIPYTMTGKDQHLLWKGKRKNAVPFPRERALFEQPDGSKMLCNTRYSLSIPIGGNAGRIHDFLQDPDATRDLWNDPGQADTKQRLLLELLWAQMDKEVMPMPRIAGA